MWPYIKVFKSLLSCSFKQTEHKGLWNRNTLKCRKSLAASITAWYFEMLIYIMGSRLSVVRTQQTMRRLHLRDIIFDCLKKMRKMFAEINSVCFCRVLVSNTKLNDCEQRGQFLTSEKHCNLGHINTYAYSTHMHSH